MIVKERASQLGFLLTLAEFVSTSGVSVHSQVNPREHAKVKNEDANDEGDNRPLDAKEQGMAMPDTHTEDQVA